MVNGKRILVLTLASDAVIYGYNKPPSYFRIPEEVSIQIVEIIEPSYPRSKNLQMTDVIRKVIERLLDRESFKVILM